jgi:alkanesulfonate monooxygenase SsuD/methylene tetrahydromethanopterin reductase-like flavin-dependent oxidoreductase (luciferase family)
VRISILNFFSPPDEVLTLAKYCDLESCFHRFWIGEHHSPRQVADPLTLAILIAGVTSRIRTGTGAISLQLRNPYMVAETALMAEAFLPGRIDLGVTKAAGLDLDPAVLRLLTIDAEPTSTLSYEQRISVMRDTLLHETDTPPFFDPRSPHAPPMFLMATNAQRAIQAAQLGVGMVSSFHHGGTLESIRGMTQAYKAQFTPNAMFARPASLAVVSGYITDIAEHSRQAEQVEQQRRAETRAGAPRRSVSVFASGLDGARQLRDLGAAAGVDEILFLCLGDDCRECYASLSKGWRLTQVGANE